MCNWEREVWDRDELLPPVGGSGDNLISVRRGKKGRVEVVIFDEEKLNPP